jgi:hypothetical protein
MIQKLRKVISLEETIISPPKNGKTILLRYEEHSQCFFLTFMELCLTNLFQKCKLCTKITLWHLQENVQQKRPEKLFHRDKAPVHSALSALTFLTTTK